jgi:cysteine desulfurase
MAYLDHAATTPTRPEVVEAMLPHLTERFGNPSGAHASARLARRAVDESRDAVAELLGCEPGEVVFTSGGTESDNTAVFGVPRRATAMEDPTVVCSAIEHHAVLDPVHALGGRTVAVDPTGRLDLDALAATLDPTVALVSLMLVNNEVGTVQPLDEAAALVRQHAPQATVHTDAVQAVSWLDVANAASRAQLISISAHKFGGPKGVGALAVRRGVSLAPLLLGGGQERGLRSGTHDVAGIVGLATAARLVLDERTVAVDRVAAHRDRLVDGLLAEIDGLHETGVAAGTGAAGRTAKIAGSAHLCIEGVRSEELLFLLEQEGVEASAASSCASGAMEPSHVLAAMGIERELAFGSLRLSLGYGTSAADVDRVLDVLPPIVARLRAGAERAR